MIHRLSILAILFIFSICIACEDTGTTTTNTPTDTPPTETPQDEPEVPLPTSHNCKPKGSVLEDNQIWLRATQTLLAIEADDATFEENVGESHRILRAYNTANCEMAFEEILPINESPDFPYFIATINYNRNSKLVAIQAAREVLLYDVENQALLSRLRPNFRKQPPSADAQSGLIQSLELYENYLFGYAADFGFFAFDLRQKQNVKPLLTEANFTASNAQRALFFVASNNNQHQALITSYNDEGQFKINALLEKPSNLNTQINDRVRNNRFIIISENINGNKKPIAIDMQKGAKVNLPNEIADKKTQEILEWLRTN